LLLFARSGKILPGTEDFDSADGFTEIFPEMSYIASQKVIGPDGNGGHENRPVFIRQVDGAAVQDAGNVRAG